jgi:hypothetical protein
VNRILTEYNHTKWIQKSCSTVIISTMIIIISFLFLRRPEKMSVNSDASSTPPLCYCGVHARLRYSWTSDNPRRKWYGCIGNFKIN